MTKLNIFLERKLMKLKQLLTIFICLLLIVGCKPTGGDDEETVTTDTTPAPAPASPGYTLSGTSFNIAENGGTATYTVKLNTQPTATVTVNISSADTGEITVSPSSLSFSTSNYATAQTVTMTGVNDNISDGNQSVAITNSVSTSDSNYSALDNQTVTAVNVDDDIVAVTYSNLATTMREITDGTTVDTDNFTVVLGAQPSADVTINFVSSDTTEATVSPDNITFSSGNYTVAQTVTVSAVHDDVDDGDIAGVTVTGSISTADSGYAALDNKTYTFTVQDVDTRGINILVAGASNLYETLPSGTTAKYWRFNLSTKPSDNVTIEMMISKPNQVTTSPASITFTPDNYTQHQYLYLNATQDNISEGNHYISVRSKSTSNDSLYHNSYTGSYDYLIVDNGTGRQPKNWIAAGNYHGLAVDRVYEYNSSPRKLYAWGDDTCGNSTGLTAESYGQCDYDNDNLSNVSDYGSGQLLPRTAMNSYVIDNSSVGDNSTNTPIFTGLEDIYKVVSTNNNSCVLYDNRTAVQCWGRYRSKNHPHGNSNNWTRQNSFTANDIDVGYEHAGMILDNGSVVMWGYDRNGALGNGARDQYGHDGSVILSNVKDLAFGTNHSCFLFDNGTVSCTGKDERDQIGISTDTSNGCGSDPCVLSPTPIEGGFNTFTQIDAGDRHTVGLLDNGSLVCWGINDSGECGTGSTSTQVNPPAISTTAPSDIDRVFVNGGKTCVITNKYKDLWCTGSYYLGDGSSSNSSTFVKVDMPSSHNTASNGDRIVDVAMTSGGVCVYTEALANAFNGLAYIYDDVFCTGAYEPSVGAGTQTMPVRTPVQLGSPF